MNSAYFIETVCDFAFSTEYLFLAKSKLCAFI